MPALRGSPMAIARAAHGRFTVTGVQAFCATALCHCPVPVPCASAPCHCPVPFPRAIAVSLPSRQLTSSGRMARFRSWPYLHRHGLQRHREAVDARAGLRPSRRPASFRGAAACPLTCNHLAA